MGKIGFKPFLILTRCEGVTIKNNARANLIKSIKWYKYTPRVYGYLMLSFLPKGNLDRLLGIKRRLNNYLN